MVWIICAIAIVVIVGTIIYFKLSLTKKQELAKTISIVGGFMAALSLLWAAYSYSESARRQTELAESGCEPSTRACGFQYVCIASTCDLVSINLSSYSTLNCPDDATDKRQSAQAKL